MDDDPAQAATIRLVIELRPNDDPIQGRLIEPADCATGFRGWLALAALIESTKARGTTGTPLTKAAQGRHR